MRQAKEIVKEFLKTSRPCKDKNLPTPTLEDYLFYYGLIATMLMIAYFLNWILP